VPATTFSTGDLVGRYRLETHLGGGSFGSVWRARDEVTGETVAVKLLAATATAEVRGEIELLAASASSRSPHVVKVLGGGTDPVPHIVMEYIEGSDLAELLTERGKLPIDEALKIGLALADALSALNAVGIVHRDVKPGNTMIDRDGVIKLADFGIAKIAGYASVTTTRQAPMTMAYAAPEVWQDEAVHQSDLYALGCVLYQCLVGTPPFMANITRLMYMHINEPPDLEKLPPTTPASLRELIRRCLAKSVPDRPSSADECTRLLNRASIEYGELESAAATSSEPERFGPWVRGKPHETLPWAWHCRHESSGEEAIVEVHSYPNVDAASVLRQAFEQNGQLVEFGAERILGFNRLLLRPGEAWASPPQGDFQFWVAREAVAAGGAGLETPAQLVDALENLTAAKRVASQLQLTLSLAGETLAVDPQPHVRILRPGLVFASTTSAQDVDGLLQHVSNAQLRETLRESTDLEQALSRARSLASAAQAGLAEAASERSVVVGEESESQIVAVLATGAEGTIQESSTTTSSPVESQSPDKEPEDEPAPDCGAQQSNTICSPRGRWSPRLTGPRRRRVCRVHASFGRLNQGIGRSAARNHLPFLHPNDRAGRCTSGVFSGIHRFAKQLRLVKR